MARSIAKSPIQPDSGSTSMFGCWPRHQVRMLVPERGEPTTKIGFLVGMAADESISYLWWNTGLRPFTRQENFSDREFVPCNKMACDRVHSCSFESQEMIGGSES